MEAETTKKENTNSNGKVILLVVLFIFFILLTFYFVYIFFAKDSFKDSDYKREQAETALEGEVYLTLSPLGEERPNIYKLDVSSMVLEEYFKDTPYRNYMAKFSPDLEEMVFIRGYENNEYQVILLNEQSGEITELTERSEIFPRNPRFSSSGEKIVYWAFEEQGYDYGEKSEDHFGNTPEDHNIYIIDKTGSREKIAEGVLPLFLPGDERVLFLKSEGLYILDLNDGQEESILPWVEQEYYEDIEIYLEEEDLEVDLPIWLIFRFNICPQGESLVITNTLDSELYLFEVSSWLPFEAYNFLNTSFPGPNWPIFSPNRESLLLQGFVSEGAYYSWIEFMHLEDLESFKTFDLDVLENWEPQSIWATDWIVR